MHARHHRARQMQRAAGVFHLWRTRSVVVIEDDELERKLIGKLRHILRSAPERRTRIGVDAFEIVKKSRRRHMPRNPEARPVGHGSIGLQEKSAFVVPDVFLVIRGGRRPQAAPQSRHPSQEARQRPEPRQPQLSHVTRSRKAAYPQPQSLPPNRGQHPKFSAGAACPPCLMWVRASALT